MKRFRISNFGFRDPSDSEKSEIRNLQSAILGLFVASWGFNKVWNLPVVGLKFQPPELFFLLLLVVSLPHFFEILKKGIALAAFEKWLLALVGVVVFHAFWIGGIEIWLEIVGLVYLISVFLMFKWLASRFETTVFIEKMARWLFVGATLTAVAGVLGWAASYFFGIEGAAYSAKRYYPYIGYFGRASGFSASADMMVFAIALGGIGAIWLQKAEKLPRWSRFAIIPMSGATVLSFSKNAFQAFATLIWHRKSVESTEKKGPKWAFRFAIAANLLIFLIPSHVLVQDKKTMDWPEFYKSSMALDTPFVFETGEKTGHWTAYALYKKTAILAGIEHFPLGIGPGQHVHWIEKLQKRGDFPTYFKPQDAHSLYSGTFGELGFIGFLMLAGLLFSIFSLLKRLKKKLEQNDWAFLVAFFLLFALEGLTADTLNFRPFWAFLGILAAISARFEPSEKT